MTTTKHEGKCCEKCNSKLMTGDFCHQHDCPCHLAEPTGAGMRGWEERFDKQFTPDYTGLKTEPYKTITVPIELKAFIQSELSRLHSRIVEEVKENLKPVSEEDKEGGWEEFYNGYNEAKRLNIELINQAFKDL